MTAENPAFKQRTYELFRKEEQSHFPKRRKNVTGARCNMRLAQSTPVANTGPVQGNLL